MQNNPPDFPPMKPVGTAKPSASTAGPLPSATPTARTEFRGTRRMKQILMAITGGGLLLTASVGVGELVLRPGIRPTDILATIEARTELGIFNQKMGAAPGEFSMTEDQYRLKIAEAERAGQAKAELAYQRDLAAVQADKERVVGAYQALYERTGIIAQAAVQMEAVAQQFRQRLVEQTNGGRAVVISVYDGLCALGSPEACESARQAREGMIREAGQLTEGNLAQKMAELMQGIPDPATFVANEDIRRNGSPALQR